MRLVTLYFSGKRKHSTILFTLSISLLLHLLIVVKTGLPLQRFKNQQSKPLDVQLSTTKLSKESVPEQQTQVTANANPLTPSSPDKSINNVAIKQRAHEPDKVPKVANTAPTHSSDIYNKDILEQNTTSQFASVDQLIPATAVDIEFNITSGHDGKILAYGRQHFVSSGENNYQLIVDGTRYSETTNNEDWQFTISGKIFRNTLSPSIYLMNGALAEQLFHLSRESRQGELITAQPKSGRMPDGILDRQSLWYHFMYSPPSNTDSELVLSDGAKISTYRMHLSSIELLDTISFGKLNTIHMVLSNIDNSETIDLWLAPNYKYLPVKIWYTAANGIITEQTVQSINIK